MSKIIDKRQGVELQIEARQGATFDRVYHAQFLSGDTYVDFDWGNYSGAVLNVKTNYNAEHSLLEFTTTDSSIELLPEGRFKLFKEYNDFNLKATEYYYDMYLIGIDGNADLKRDFIYGKFIIYKKITD